MVNNNIIHRDIKAANIMINDKVWKIGDFGFAKEAELANSTLGTPLHMVNIYLILLTFEKAPELFINAQYTNKVDIWSIGVLFY